MTINRKPFHTAYLLAPDDASNISRTSTGQNFAEYDDDDDGDVNEDERHLLRAMTDCYVIHVEISGEDQERIKTHASHPSSEPTLTMLVAHFSLIIIRLYALINVGFVHP